MESLHQEEPANRPTLRVLQGEARSLPHSVEAEEFLLACCFIDGASVVARCHGSRLVPAAFYDQRHGVVFEKILDLHRRGLPISIDVVAEELKTSKQLEAIGGFGFLAQISSRVGTTAEANYFIDQVRNQFLLREAIRQGGRFVEECYGWSGSPLHELFGKYAAKWQKAAAWAQGRALHSMRDVAVAATARAEAAILGKVDRTRWLYTGLPYFDEKLTPLDCNDEDWLIILAGLRSQGKSSLGRQWAVHNFERGKRGIVFTLETGARGWLERAAAVHAKIDMRNRDRELLEKIALYRNRLAEQEAWMEERMWIYDNVDTIEEIELRTREVDQSIREREIARGVPADEARGLDFILVDYLQQVKTRKRCRTREEEVADVSGRLRSLLKTVNITGLILAQLSRKAEQDKRPPVLSDLRESGQIEQDAVRVWALELPAEGRDKIPQDVSTETPLMRIWQLKNRNGPTGGVEVLFHKKWTWFEDAPRKGGNTVRPGDPKPAGGYKRQ